ncbi:MAG TPA: GatB/YqeY domain-containing protein [Thiobacillaceae bacterium]|nr:GatB/YqeY domain-containing protein [Thiobacillaceae bacterium]HNU64091.1 GatB/YqeY domain-containing protein [Thiobacillaceae bacterium]
MSLKTRVTEDMKAALRAREAGRLGTIRLLLAAIRQKEVDERLELDEAGITAVIEKMVKQRRDAIGQYVAGGRQDLADREQAEIDVLSGYLPQPFDAGEITALIHQAQAETGAAGPRDMGKMMAWLKPRMAGRADMTAVSDQVRALLG